jgi:hypothetical protein
MSVLSAFIVSVVVFMGLFPLFMILTEIWVTAQPIIVATCPPSVPSCAKTINQLGNETFEYIPDTALTLLYFGLIAAVFISALYEAAHPETLPIGLFFLIVLIFVTFPLSDYGHAFYTNPGFLNVSAYYSSTEYLSDNSPILTALFTLAYLLFVTTKRTTIIQGMPQGSGIVNG